MRIKEVKTIIRHCTEVGDGLMWSLEGSGLSWCEARLQCRLWGGDLAELSNFQQISTFTSMVAQNPGLSALGEGERLVDSSYGISLSGI